MLRRCAVKVHPHCTHMTWITVSPWVEVVAVLLDCAQVRHTCPRHFGLLVPQCQMCLDLSLLGLLKDEKLRFGVHGIVRSERLNVRYGDGERGAGR